MQSCASVLRLFLSSFSFAGFIRLFIKLVVTGIKHAKRMCRLYFKDIESIRLVEISYAIL